MFVKEPKLRIKKVFKEVMDNNGFNVRKAMLNNGYSPNSAKNPKQVTESKSWEMLLEEYLPDDLLTKVAQEGLKSTMVKTSFTEPDRELPDMPTRRQYLETVLKMKGKIVDKSENKDTGEIRIRFVDEKNGPTD